jgi:hypothetical protein
VHGPLLFPTDRHMLSSNFCVMRVVGKLKLKPEKKKLAPTQHREHHFRVHHNHNHKACAVMLVVRHRAPISKDYLHILQSSSHARTMPC